MSISLYNKDLEKNLDVKIKMNKLDNGQWRVKEVTNLVQLLEEIKKAEIAKAKAEDKISREKIYKIVNIKLMDAHIEKSGDYFPTYKLITTVDIPNTSENDVKNVLPLIQYNDKYKLRQNEHNYAQNNEKINVPMASFHEEEPGKPTLNFSVILKIFFALLSIVIVFHTFSGGNEPQKDIQKEEIKPPKITESIPQPESNVVTPRIEYTISYVGNRGTRKFHRDNCGSVSTMKESKKVFFSNRNEAVNSGYTPCQRCNP